MALKQELIVKIILEQSANIEERCPGYREELIETISDIVLFERQHRIQGTNIQQKISDKCNATGRFLNDNKRHK